jgi:hypothetical protein
MLFFLLLLFIIYFIVVQIVSAIVKALRPKAVTDGIHLGAAVACGIVFFIVLAADLIFESDEHYWYYETDWRLPVLFGASAFISVTALILGPVLGIRIRRKTASGSKLSKEF